MLLMFSCHETLLVVFPNQHFLTPWRQVHLCDSSNYATSTMHMICVQSYESLHGVAIIHRTSKMTYIVVGTLYSQSMTLFITCFPCLELYCLIGNFLLVSSLDAFSGNLSSFFKLVHTIWSCSLSVHLIFILSFSLSSCSSPSLPPSPPACTHPATHAQYFYTM